MTAAWSSATRGGWRRPPVTVWLALPFAGWPLYCLLQGEHRWELLAAVFLGAGLPHLGAGARRLYWCILPLGFVGLLYDSMRFVRNVGVTPERVHVCDLRNLELQWFGTHVGDRLVTWHDWLQPRASLPLDVLFSIPYGTFLGAAFGFAVFLYFVDYAAARRFTGAFFVLNLAAFVTYHLYPAAPPWYFHAHAPSCVADVAARASEGPNLARVDAWLGVRYFGGFYGRSQSVFGAVPSLHVAYPLLVVLEGYRPFGTIGRPALGWTLRVASGLFFVWMCVAAVYLDHHWIIDVVVGVAYALVVFVGFRVGSLLARRSLAGMPVSGSTVA